MTADKIYRNGNIHTIDSENRVVSAVAVKDGRFIYAGDDEGAADYIGAKTEVIDLMGRAVLPGLIESHVHTPGNAYNVLYNIDLFKAKTAEETEQIIEDFIRAHPGNDVYYGRGFNMALFPGEETSKGPRKERLDRICSDRPIVIINGGGHISWLNSKALELSGITCDTPDVEGGIIEKDDATGELWGVLKDNARELCPERRYTGEERATAFEWFQNYFVSLGFTGMLSQRQSASLDPVPIVETMAEFEKRGELKLHVSAAREIKVTEDVERQLEHLDEMRDLCQKEGSELQVGTAKFFIDGTVEGVNAYLSQPYCLFAGKGDSFCSESLWEYDRLKEAFCEVLRRGFNIHIHAIGDAAITEAIDALEYAQNLYPGDHRNCITHLQVVKPEDIRRMGELGIVACLNSFWHYKAPAEYFESELKLLGPERAEREYPAKSFVDAGCVNTCSADYPVSPSPDPFLGMEIGVTRNIPAIELPDGDRMTDMDDPRFLLGKEERLSVMDMVRAYTINAAYAIHREDTMGSIEAGKWADMVVLNQDVFEVDPLEIEETKVLKTIFKGEIVYERD